MAIASRVLDGSVLLPLIHMARWSDNDEIQRDAMHGIVSLTHAPENRAVIAECGGFSALLACLRDADGDAASSPAPAGPKTSPSGTQACLEDPSVPLRTLKTIISMKRAASKALRRSRQYTVKRLAIESISNLLAEPENHETFIRLGGLETLCALIERNAVFIPEAKQICEALVYLSRNTGLRLEVYNHRFLDIVKRVVNDADQPELVHRVLRALRNLTTPVTHGQMPATPGDSTAAAAIRATSAPRHIRWTDEDLQFFSSILMMPGLDAKQFKLALDILRNAGAGDGLTRNIIRHGGAHLLARFFECAVTISSMSATKVRDSGSRCIAALSTQGEDNAAGSDEAGPANLSKLQEMLDLSLHNTDPSRDHQNRDKLRSTTRFLLDFCVNDDARMWMSHQEFLVALLQIIRTKDIVAVRCAAAILAELTAQNTVHFLIPHTAHLIESLVGMDADMQSQLDILRVLEIMAKEDKSVVTSCALFTAELIGVCEKLVQHASSDTGNSDKSSHCVIAFALALSFHDTAKSVLQEKLPELKYMQHLLQGNDSAIKEQTVHFIHNVYDTFDRNKPISLAAESVWFMKKYARARSNTEAGMRAHDIAKHHELDLAAQTIQRFYRAFRAKKYISKLEANRYRRIPPSAPSPSPSSSSSSSSSFLNDTKRRYHHHNHYAFTTTTTTK